MIPKQKYTELSPQSLTTSFPTMTELFGVAEICFFACEMGVFAPPPVSQELVGSCETGLVRYSILQVLWWPSSARSCSHIGNKTDAF